MDFFVDHAVLFALVCSGVAIAYGLYLIVLAKYRRVRTA